MATPIDELDDNEPSETVNLNTAYVWACPNCSHENFGHMVAAELTDDERLDLQKLIDPDHGADWKEPNSSGFVEEMGLVMHPVNVQCGGCGKTFETEKDTIDPEDLPERFRPPT